MLRRTIHYHSITSSRLGYGLLQQKSPKLPSEVPHLRLAKYRPARGIQRDEVINDYLLHAPIHTEDYPVNALLVIALPLKGSPDDFRILGQGSQSRQDEAVPLIPMQDVRGINGKVKECGVVDEVGHSFPGDCSDGANAA